MAVTRDQVRRIAELAVDDAAAAALGQQLTRILDYVRQLDALDTGGAGSWVRAVVEAHPGEVARWRAGEEKLFGFLAGQAMQRPRRRADPKRLNAAPLEALKS